MNASIQNCSRRRKYKPEGETEWTGGGSETRIPQERREGPPEQPADQAGVQQQNLSPSRPRAPDPDKRYRLVGANPL